MEILFPFWCSVCSLNGYLTFINFAVDGHLVCFQFGVISNKATMNILDGFLWYICIDILGKYRPTNKIAWSW